MFEITPTHNGWFEIRQVPDDPETLRSLVTKAEWAEALSMSPVSRRAEWLAWRAVVRKRLGKDIPVTYDCYGAPVLPEGMGHIGISHTKGWVAAVWSEESCAVDIELASRDVSRTAARFVSQEELALPDSANHLFPISVWCAKEAAYKLSRTPGLDFLKDIKITSSDIAGGRMEVCIGGGELHTVELFLRDGLVIAIIRQK